MDGGTLNGSPDGQNTAYYANMLNAPLFGVCISIGGGASASHNFTVPVTYANGLQGVPLDSNSVSLYDVMPMQSNQEVSTSRVIPDVQNNETDTADLAQPSGDPTLHNHRIDLVKGDHTYKVKTNAIVVNPENIETTMNIGADASRSIDSATTPFTVMEFLIKT